MIRRVTPDTRFFVAYKDGAPRLREWLLFLEAFTPLFWEERK